METMGYVLAHAENVSAPPISLQKGRVLSGDIASGDDVLEEGALACIKREEEGLDGALSKSVEESEEDEEDGGAGECDMCDGGLEPDFRRRELEHDW